MQVTVTVPATSANLGPGFDCLGMAIGLTNTITAEVRPEPGFSISVSGEGAGSIPCDDRNLVYQAMQDLAAHVGQTLPPFNLFQNNQVPSASGMGSSSTAIVGGLLTANALLKEPLSRAEVLNLAIEIEGHPDNVAPAILGGLVLATQARGTECPIIQQYDLPELKVVMVLPDFELLTQDARDALPKSVPLQDAIYNMSRIPLVIQALIQADFDRMASVMSDQLHQPYRMALVPGMAEAMAAGRAAGAAAVAISGAGPSLIAFSEKQHDAIGEAMQQAFAQADLQSRRWHMTTHRLGASVSVS